MNREPFVKLLPVFKDYLWGGTKLKSLYGAKETIVAEAWLLSAHPGRGKRDRGRPVRRADAAGIPQS